MAARRTKALSEADKAVWRAYTAHVLPLPGRELPDAPPAPIPSPPPAAPARPLSAPGKKTPQPPAEVHVGTPPPGLDAKHWQKLRRGRTRPERTLDLHGRRAQEAHGALRGFILAAWADGLRCVAVVTGKGSSPEGGILRRELPHWLNAPDLRPLILGAAHPHASNPGAVHLLLRRRRGPPR
jgi:DNA-nicking Smr family endonuclease